MPSSLIPAVHELHGLGLNVVPLPAYPEPQWPWQMLRYVRLLPQHLDLCFGGDCNIGVVTGRTSGNLAVIHCQSDVSYERTAGELRDRDIPRWSFRSEAGGYYLLRVVEGVVKNTALDGVKVLGGDDCMPVPPVFHWETGEIVNWDWHEGDAPPTVPVETLDWLGVVLAVDPLPRIYRGPSGVLSPRTRYFIEQGTRAEWSRELFLAARDAAGCGLPQKEAIELLRPTMGLSGRDPYRDYDEFRQTVDRAYQKDNEPAVKHEWQYALARMQDFAWPSRTENTDRPVLVALIERARLDARNGEFRASGRELANLAGRPRKTVRKSLKRLQAFGVIEKVGVDRGGSSLWRFTETFLRREERIETFPTNHTEGLDSGVTLAHDGAHSWALNVKGLRLWRMLSAYGKPAKRGQIARLTGMSPSSVYHYLKKLERHEIASREGQWWSVVPFTEERLDQVALVAGTAGTGIRRKDRHNRERATWAARQLCRARGIEWPKREEEDTRPSGIRHLEQRLWERDTELKAGWAFDVETRWETD